MKNECTHEHFNLKHKLDNDGYSPIPLIGMNADPEAAKRFMQCARHFVFNSSVNEDEFSAAYNAYCDIMHPTWYHRLWAMLALARMEYWFTSQNKTSLSKKQA